MYPQYRHTSNIGTTHQLRIVVWHLFIHFLLLLYLLLFVRREKPIDTNAMKTSRHIGNRSRKNRLNFYDKGH